MNRRKTKWFRVSAAVMLVMALGVSLMGTVAAGNGNGNGGNGRPVVVSALGIAQVQGQDVLVEVLVLVLPGGDAGAAAQAALESQGARPIEPHELGTAPDTGDKVGFTLTGLVWITLPTQNYNPANEAVSGNAALVSSQGTWGAPTSSRATISDGGTTTRCPSLVKECKGPQVFDTFNDVGWLDLGRPKRGFVTLGVTWSGTSNLTGPEADMALTTNGAVTWVDSDTLGAGEVDVETVFLHENGHVLGLGHSADLTSVMFRSISGADRILGTDDVEGITFLYDSHIKGSVKGTVSDGTSPIEGATVVLEGTGLSTTTAADGTYTIPGVPDPVTYTVVASADGFDSGKKRETVNGPSPTTVDFSLASAGDEEPGNGGGACPPAKAAKGKC